MNDKDFSILREQLAKSIREKEVSTDRRPSYRCADAVLTVVLPRIEALEEEVRQLQERLS